VPFPISARGSGAAILFRLLRGLSSFLTVPSTCRPIDLLLLVLFSSLPPSSVDFASRSFCRNLSASISRLSPSSNYRVGCSSPLDPLAPLRGDADFCVASVAFFFFSAWPVCGYGALRLFTRLSRSYVLFRAFFSIGRDTGQASSCPKPPCDPARLEPHCLDWVSVCLLPPHQNKTFFVSGPGRGLNPPRFLGDWMGQDFTRTPFLPILLYTFWSPPSLFLTHTSLVVPLWLVFALGMVP